MTDASAQTPVTANYPTTNDARYDELLAKMLDAYREYTAEPYRYTERRYDDATDAFCAYVVEYGSKVPRT